ncbi:hypothetical protein ACTWQF_30385 [Streptomyces sp. 8N114]|uniref:hypothetical protein n=1 Tax=Streptomyces sp. 8N114 TaxID=3457419 RepID=UPI003FD1AFCB
MVLDAALGFDNDSDDSLPPPMMAAMGVTDTGLDDPDRLYELLEQVREDGRYSRTKFSTTHSPPSWPPPASP